ncbi:hypothetical protein ABZY02_35205 [Streptomyces sp. NPDC006649]|uniref:hypothetical protein n=1 Tax=Streptomyces sp. NPDC006649 TaxID=3156896 RepID=UPI0033A53E3A
MFNLIQDGYVITTIGDDDVHLECSADMLGLHEARKQYQDVKQSTGVHWPVHRDDTDLVSRAKANGDAVLDALDADPVSVAHSD